MALNKTIDLTPDQRETLVSLLSRHLPNTEAWVYGSRVRGTSRPASDLDMVVFATPEQAPRVSELRESFEESNLPFRVDLFIWDEVPNSFRKQIEREHVVLTNTARGFHRKWPRVALRDVIDLRLSSVDKKTKPNEIPVRLCNYTDVYYNSSIHQNMSFMEATASDREIAKCALTSGDVLITKDSEKYDDIGVPAFVMDDVPDLVCGYHLAILRPDAKRIHGRFLFYALNANDAQTQFHYYANGITRFGLRKADIGLVEIPLPCLEEQRAIAYILGALDDKIEVNRRMNETLEAMARAIFKDWFVDFGPTRAKAEGREPYLAPEIWDLFPDALDDDGKPVGWNRERIGNHVSAARGLSYTGAGLTDDTNGIPLHNLNSILEGGGYKNDGLKFYSGDYKQTHLLRPGDLIVANTEQGFGHLLIGYSALIPAWVGMEGIFSHHIFKIEPHTTSSLSRVWLHFALSTSWLGEEVRRYSNGTTINMLPRDALQLPLAIVPSSGLVQAFDALVGPKLRRQEDAVEESRTLTQTRDLLLPKLMSGEIRLRDAEEAVEAVT